MFLLEPQETAYDLRWQMFGIPVRVHPMFWLVTLIMGGNALQQGVAYLLIWVACVFVSILVHELGHVVMGRIFGAEGRIILYGFGGLAVGSNQLRHRMERIAVSFAGPLAGSLFLGLVFLALYARDPVLFPAYVAVAKAEFGTPLPQGAEIRQLLGELFQLHRMELSVVSDLIFINLLWGIVNLLPVWPLDGGQICRDALGGITPGREITLSLGISLVTAGILAIHSLMVVYDRPLLPLPFGSKYSAFLFGMLAFQSYQLLQQASAERRWQDEHWDRGDY